MFKFIKDIKNLEALVYKIDSRFVSCEKCKMVLFKDDAQKIEIESEYPTPFGTRPMTAREYYCPAHTKPYDKVVEINNKQYHYKNIPETPSKTIFVDEKGKEIKK